MTLNQPAWLALRWSLTVVGWIATAAFVLGAVFWLPGRVLPAPARGFFDLGVALVGLAYACCMSQALRNAPVPLASRAPTFAWAAPRWSTSPRPRPPSWG